MKILLIGPQGSGKSTQGRWLSQHLNIPYISTGDIFREKAAEDSDEGRRIKQILEEGQLVDDETTRKLVDERLKKEDVQNGFILDGYPRTSEQVDLFKVLDVKFDKIFYLKVPQNLLVERLMKRGRKDDTPEIIKVRLENYINKTEALIQALTSFGNLVEINAVGDIQTVQDEIKKSL